MKAMKEPKLKVEQLAPAFRASRVATRPFRALQPGDWVDALLACREPAVALIDSEATPGNMRRAVGTARKAMLEPAEFLSALQSLRCTLAESAAMNAPRNAEH
jgi:hypothetical protein